MSSKRKANVQFENVLSKKLKIEDQNQNQNIANVSESSAIESASKLPSKLPEDVLKRIEVEKGKVVMAGNVAWDTVGRSGSRNELAIFHRLDDRMYRGVASSCSAAHSLLIDSEYKVYSFGRNQFGQLGHEKLETFNTPEKIETLANVNIIQSACGKNHSLFLTDTGVVYACGESKNGQLGMGKTSRKLITKPTPIKYNGAPIVKVGCGADFSVILDVNGNLYSFGLPEYGQLGHNTDGKYFLTNTKLASDQVWTPRLITSYIEKSKQGHATPISDVRIVEFACGKNHTIAIDSEKRAFSFGFGGYGRLGHNEVADEWIPRLIKYLNITVTGGAVRAYCGSTYSIVISGHSNVYFFGKNSSRMGQVFPQVVNDLCGFNIKSIGCSNTSMVLAADNNVIAWGSSPTFGELGIGTTPKSSASPRFVENLDGANVSQVAMGLEHTLLIMNTDDDNTNEKYLALPQFSMF